MRKIGLFVIICTVSVVSGYSDPPALAAEKIKWRMGTTWTPAINLYVGEKTMIKYVKEMTGGNFDIRLVSLRFTDEGL